MRTSIKREVERNNLDQITDRFTTIYIKGNAKETEDQVFEYAVEMINYIQANTYYTASIQETGNDKEVMICTDATEYEDFAELKEAYTEFKSGARVEAAVATIETVVQEDTIQEVETVVGETIETTEATTKTIISIAKKYVALCKDDKDRFINNDISTLIKGELEHTVFNWACDILNGSSYIKECLSDENWIYYKQFIKLYNLIGESRCIS